MISDKISYRFFKSNVISILVVISYTYLTVIFIITINIIAIINISKKNLETVTMSKYN